ncbi:MAG TPA: signal peptidase II [Candidatus Omnitrophota bacterium]|nr:signal peptidase II [Candidatus Omnitrophota bacterium]
MRDLKRSQFDMILAVLSTLTVVLLDRATKYFFMNVLSLGESFPVIRNVFHMTLVHNTGIAFGFFKEHGSVFIIIPIIATILLVFNIFYYKHNDEALSRSYILGFSLILGGAVGNLIDRIRFGYVIDFIDFRVWPVFNIADSAITIGAVIIAWKCFQVKQN